MKRNMRGQSVLEYVVILTAVIAAVLAAVVTLGGKNTNSGLGKLLNQAATKITTESAKVGNIVNQ